MIGNAIQILDENREMVGMTISEYHKHCKENDPTYYFWLFGSEADNIGDYGTGMTAEQQKQMERFDESVKSLQEIRDGHTL